MTQIHIEPIDTLFFRDSRSFTAGEISSAEFNFPSPLTFFGAIGSAVLENSKAVDRVLFFQRKRDHPKLGKYSEKLTLEETRMRLKGPFLHKGNEVYFPPPANLRVSGTGPFYVPHILAPYGRDWLEGGEWLWDLNINNSNMNTKYLRPLKIPEDTDPLNQLISTEVLTHYLAGDLNILTSESEDKFFSREIRYGHAISKNSKTVEERFFYSAPHLRFIDKIDYGANKYVKSGFTLVVEGIDESDLPDNIISLGGERRKATVAFDKTELIPEMPEVMEKIEENNNKFFIYLATPAIFKGGWCIDLPPDFKGAKLVGAAVNKPLHISGWKNNSNNSSGEPRPIEKAVPAGSVYFFEADSWDSKKFEYIYEKYNFKDSFSSIYQAAGFGIGLFGSW